MSPQDCQPSVLACVPQTALSVPPARRRSRHISLLFLPTRRRASWHGGCQPSPARCVRGEREQSRIPDAADPPGRAECAGQQAWAHRWRRRCSALLPRARNPDLLRLLVAYEIIWDFLDSVNEHGASAGQSKRPSAAPRADRGARP